MVRDCQRDVAYLFDTVRLLIGAQMVIDHHLVSAYEPLPQSCVPEVLKETNGAVEESCPLEGKVEMLNLEHRAFARGVLDKLAGELEESAAAMPQALPYKTSYRETAEVVRRESKNISLTDKSELVAAPGLTDLVDDALFELLTEFDRCMRG